MHASTHMCSHTCLHTDAHTTPSHLHSVEPGMCIHKQAPSAQHPRPFTTFQAVSHLQSTSAGKFSLKFVEYAQSNQCQSPNDSSVSYASASLVAAAGPGQH